MKNKEFFYLQYDKLKWENQDKTKINSYVNNWIINNIFLKKKSDKISVFDIGFGIGFFFKMLKKNLPEKFNEIVLEGCEPSYKNYDYFNKNLSKEKTNRLKIKGHNKTFQNLKSENKFDFITAIYVFPHFESSELENISKKIYSMLENYGKFILVVAKENYLEDKLKAKRDLFIEKNFLELKGKRYNEFLHYSEIPQIGTVIDYNREERFYIDLFEMNGFSLESKTDLDDNGFICTIFVFSKK